MRERGGGGVGGRTGGKGGFGQEPSWIINRTNSHAYGGWKGTDVHICTNG